jgi:DNA primase
MASSWINFEKIKREADFATVLAHYGFTLPEGRAQLKLPCPFHADGRPSLSVNLAEGLFHCFGCAARGNVLDFVVLTRKRRGERPSSARAAAKELAAICGLTGYETERPAGGRPAAAQRAVRGGSGRETVEEPCGARSRPGEAPMGSEGHAEPREVNPPLAFALKLDPAHPYLRERGLSAELVEAFGLGYCGRGLMKGRVCVPIHNEHGELVAYAGRWVGPDATIPEGEGKWKLPPTFEKSRVLYNLHRIEHPSHLILVEGPFSVVRLDGLGMPAAALLGRDLSEHQLGLIEDAGTRRLTLLLDGDEPGRRAVAEIMGRLARTPFAVRAAMLPEGAQPDTAPSALIQELLAFWPHGLGVA